MTKKELEFKIVSVKRSIATKKKELQEEQNYLKSLEKALQEELRGDQMDMFESESRQRRLDKIARYAERYGSSLSKLGDYTYMSKGD